MAADAWCCLSQESDEAVERVLAVEVLHLMRSPGAYSVSVGDMLGGSEVWQAYKHQKHDLFLPTAGDRSVSRGSWLVETSEGMRRSGSLCGTVSFCWSMQ